jgi:hypothetical protein
MMAGMVMVVWPESCCTALKGRPRELSDPKRHVIVGRYGVRCSLFVVKRSL